MLETACEYIEELNEMGTQFNQLKLSKELLGTLKPLPKLPLLY